MSSKPKISAWKKPNLLTEEKIKDYLQNISSAVEIAYTVDGMSSFQVVYQSVFELIHGKKGEEIYKLVTSLIEKHIKNLPSSGISYNILEDVHSIWSKNKLALTHIKGLMLYVENTYIKDRAIKSFYNYGLELFKDLIFVEADIGVKIKQSLINEACKNKTGEVFDKNIIRSITGMLIELGLGSNIAYRDIFEKDFLEKSKKFYEEESARLISTLKLPEYLRYIKKRMGQEAEFAESIIDISSRDKILEVIDELFIVRFSNNIIGSKEFDFMIDSQDLETLKILYELYIRSPKCIQDVVKGMKDYIKLKIQAILSDEVNGKKPIVTIESVLELFDKVFRVCGQSFQRSQLIELSIKLAFEEHLNVSHRIIVFSSIYIDNFMIKEVKCLSEMEIDVKVYRFMQLFSLLKGKDIFELKYRDFLALRLLEGKSKNLEAERAVVKLIKQECGLNYVNKIEGMLNDISKEEATFESDLFNTKVLTGSYWPQEKLMQIVLPVSLGSVCSEFLKKYNVNHQGRRLSWRFEYGSALVKANLGESNKKYDLVCTIFQAVILLMFNNKDSYNLTELLTEIRGSENELKKHILGLVKGKILKKTSKGKSLEVKDVLEVNQKYSSKLLRIVLEAYSGNSKEEKEKVEESTINEERKYAIEAAIVKIMKARRILEHRQLVIEVVKFCQEKFNPDVKMIKTRVEALIEKEFLKRDATSIDVYHYIT